MEHFEGMNVLEKIKLIDITAREVAQSSPLTVQIDGTHLVKVCSILQADPTFYFDHLACITGLDNGEATGTLEVIYHLYSIPFHQSLALKVVLARNEAKIDSITSLWGGANWLEREVFDMFGIMFNNHPDLRRILMPADWEGYPLRKDFQHQETYRDIQVKY
jgi:NADH-quinone oxidoreductase subunit C